MKRFNEKRTGILSFMDLKSPACKAGYWVMFTVLVVLVLVRLLPPVWVLVSSFKGTTEVMKVPPAFLPEHFDLSKVADVWKKLDFMKYYVNTLVLAAGSLVCSVVVNGLTGYVLSRLKPRGSKMIFTLVIWTMLMPATLSMVPLFKNMVDFPLLHVNLSNTFLPMWICAGASAFNILLFKNAFDSISISLIEAARLDGCNSLGIFLRIVLPLSVPIIMVVCIFSINGTWGDFMLPYLILTDRNRYTVMVQIYTTKTGIPIDYQLMSLVFAIVPPILIFFIFQKHIIAGVTMGGVKE